MLAATILLREARDQWRWTLGLALGATVLALLLSSRRGLGLSPLAAVVAIVPPFALAALPSSVVDDAASGFVRLVQTQPLVPGAYALLRVAAAAAVAFVVVAPLAAALALWGGDAGSLPRALPVLALACLWCAAAAILLGLLLRGSAAATGVWILLAALNLQAALYVLSGTPPEDLLFRLRHALPAAPAAQTALPRADPWAWGAPVVLALEAGLAAALAWRHAARGWRHGEPSRGRGALAAGALAALVLPLLLPLAEASA